MRLNPLTCLALPQDILTLFYSSLCFRYSVTKGAVGEIKYMVKGLSNVIFKAPLTSALYDCPLEKPQKALARAFEQEKSGLHYFLFIFNQ